MLKKIKNWLIHRLGGYTKFEYDLVNHHALQIQRNIVRPHNIEKVQVETRLGRMDLDPEYRLRTVDYVKEQLRRELLRRLEPYIEFQTCEDDFDVAIRASVSVVRRED